VGEQRFIFSTLIIKIDAIWSRLPVVNQWQIWELKWEALPRQLYY
jgi:hypothetical protein